tara:strand:+ start:559 stop:1041 length:483 start_codon:yes stop_codon:yes gene_type:complete
MRVGTSSPALNHLPRIIKQVPSIGDLDRARGADGDGAPIFARAIPCDDFDTGPLVEPVAHCSRGAIGQEINWAMALEIDDDRAIAQPLLHGPIIDADDGGLRRDRLRHSADKTQDRVAARRHRKLSRKATACCAAECNPDLRLRLGKPPGSQRRRRNQQR